MIEAKRHYELELTGNDETIDFLKQYLAVTYPTIAIANAKRRAITVLFNDAVKVKIVSVQVIPAKTTRRILRIP